MSQTYAPPRSVDEYLRQLRAALAGEAPALIQDALGDAEDYMREEVALEPFKPESEVVARISRSFGLPHEVAAEYRAVEERMNRRSGAAPSPRAGRARRGGPGFFGVLVDGRAYAAALYALLALPLGVFYFTWVTTGLSLSAGLAILIIGVPFILLFILSVRVLAHVEGRVVELLTGQRMPRRLAAEREARKGLWETIKAMLADRRTWSAMIYMLLQLPLGVVYFVIAVVGLVVPAALIAGPFVHAAGRGGVRWGNPEIQAFFESPVGIVAGVAIGALLFIAMLHALRALARLHGRYAEAMLVRI